MAIKEDPSKVHYDEESVKAKIETPQNILLNACVSGLRVSPDSKILKRAYGVSPEIEEAEIREELEP